MSGVKKWVFIILFSALWGVLSVFVCRFVFGLPSSVSGVVAGLGGALFLVWINGDLKKGEGALKEFEEHEERMRISRLYDESLKKKSE
jgi:hypothetical protein